MAMPRLGHTTNVSPAMQKFLDAHPVFARMTGVKERQQFLNKHPEIAQAYQRVIHPPAAAAPAPAPAAAAPAAAAAAPGPDRASASAKAAITSTLDSYGLGGLGDWAWSQYLNGAPIEQIMLDLRKQPQYAQRFPGMAELSKKGRAVSESEYIGLERSYAQQARAYGLPEGFYDDPTDFGRLIEGEVSAQEWGERLQMAQQTALTDPRGQAMRDFLSRNYGVANSVGAVTAYWIDPDRSASLIKQQYAASQIAAESTTTGFGSLNKTQAENLAAAGVTQDQARTGFSQLAGLTELRTGLIGDAGSQAITDNQLVDAQFLGDAAAQKAVRKETRRRQVAFEGGGSYATGQGGVSGLGSAAT